MSSFGDDVIGQLKARLAADPKKPRVASRFMNEESADWAIGKTLTANQRKVEDWLQSPSNLDLPIVREFHTAIGVRLDRTGLVSPVQRVRVILRKSRAFPSGYRIHTAFPIE